MIRVAIELVVVVVMAYVAVSNININTIDHTYDMDLVESQYETLHEELLIKESEVVALKGTLVFMDAQHRKEKSANVRVTYYHPATGGINCDSDPTKTALGTTPTAGRTCALSTSLVRKGWLGRSVYIEGYGVFVAEDRMNVNLKGDRIDICAPTLKYALKGGATMDVFCNPL